MAGMGFLDKAKAAATELAAKADTALASAGMAGPGMAAARDADRYLRDLGVLAYAEATGRPFSTEERERVLAALRGIDAAGGLPSLTLQTAPPPPPGAAAAGGWSGSVGGAAGSGGGGGVSAPPPPPPGGGFAPPPPPPPPPSAT